VDCGCGWGDLCDAPREHAPHWHVATGLAGYGPDGDDGFACFDTLSDALEYAREEITRSVDDADETAYAHADNRDYEAAWQEKRRADDLTALAANLAPTRREAPAYRDDPAAYASMQEDQAAQFPYAVSHNTRLYLWQCDDPAACEHCDTEEEAWAKRADGNTLAAMVTTGVLPSDHPSVVAARAEITRREGGA
jgi:hypothetical protein